MDGLGTQLSLSGIGCKVGRIFCNNLFYADDIVILAPSVSALKSLITICQVYAKDHNIMFNSNKTMCMRFSHDRKKAAKLPNIQLDRKLLQWVDSYTYLGYDISNTCSNHDDNEMMNVIK